MKAGRIDPLLIVAAVVVGFIIAIVVVRVANPPVPASSLRTEPRQVFSVKQLDPQDLDDIQGICSKLCAAAVDTNGTYTFCRRTVNMSSPEASEMAVRIGDQSACRSKIPCFVAIPDCAGITATTCRELLLQDTKDYLEFVRDVNAARITASGGCDLPSAGVEIETNWIVRSDFSVQATNQWS